MYVINTILVGNIKINNDVLIFYYIYVGTLKLIIVKNLKVPKKLTSNKSIVSNELYTAIDTGIIILNIIIR